MDHKIPHNLDPRLAKEVAIKAFEAYSARFPKNQPSLVWQNENQAKIGFQVKGMNLNGTLGIEPHAIALDLDVPFMLRVFKKPALDVIEREVQTWLEKAKNGEIKLEGA